MKHLLFLFLAICQLSQAQIILPIESIQIEGGDKIGQPMHIRAADGSDLADGQYTIQDDGIHFTFHLENNTFTSPFKVINASANNRLRFEFLIENNRIVEIREYDVYAIDSLNTGPQTPSSITTFEDGIYCYTRFQDDTISYRACYSNADDFEYRNSPIYLYSCYTKTDQPNNRYCEEENHNTRVYRYFKNGALYKEIAVLDDSNGAYQKTTRYSKGQLIDERYDYGDSIATVNADKSYTIEIKEDSRTSAVKRSNLTAYTKEGAVLYTEQIERERSFEGITTVKRFRQGKTIIELYDNDMNLIERKEE